MRKFLLISFLSFFASCNNNQSEIAILQEKITSLETKIDNCQNGSDKLLATLKLNFEEGKFDKAKEVFSEIKKRHPESQEYAEASEINEKIIEEEDKKKAEEEKRIAAEKAEKLEALNKLKKTEDDVSGITWYKQPYFTHYTNTNRTSIYFGEMSGTPWLILLMTYTGDDWIFFENAYLSYDGNTREIYFNEYEDKETDNGNGGVWEWITLSIDDEMIPFLRELANSPNAKMRLSGKYTMTRELSKNEKQGIIDVLNGYEVLKNKDLSESNGTTD